MLIWTAHIGGTIASLVLTGGVGGEPPGAVRDARAVALCRGLEAYENSIASLRWGQVWYAPPSRNRNLDRWIVGEESERYVDEFGNWFHVSRMFMNDGPPDWTVRYHHNLYFGSGAVRVASELDKGRGLVDDPDSFFAGGGNAWRAMGRFLEYSDFVRGRPASALMEDASGLEYLEPTESEPWPGVRAVGAVSGGLVDIEMRVDPDHGFAPRVIRTPRRSDRASAELLVILELQDVDGVWIPRVGLTANYYTERVADPARCLPAEREKDFEAARSLNGLPSEAQSAELRRWIGEAQAVRVFDQAAGIVGGPLVCFNPDEAICSPNVFIVSWVRVNEPMTRDAMIGYLPVGTEMANAFMHEFHRSVDDARGFLSGLETPRSTDAPGNP